MKRALIIGATVLAPAGIVAAGVQHVPGNSAPAAVQVPTPNYPIEPDPIPNRGVTAIPVLHTVIPKAVVHKAIPKRSTKVKVKVVKAKPHVRTYATNMSWNAPALQAIWHRYPSWVQQTALCIAHHESWSAGLWTAQNSSSSASGMGQWLTGSWQIQAARAGFSGPAKAKYASPAEQVSVMAYQLAHYGAYPWVGAGCGHGS